METGMVTITRRKTHKQVFSSKITRSSTLQAPFVNPPRKQVPPASQMDVQGLQHSRKGTQGSLAHPKGGEVKQAVWDR